MHLFQSILQSRFPMCCFPVPSWQRHFPLYSLICLVYDEYQKFHWNVSISCPIISSSSQCDNIGSSYGQWPPEDRYVVSNPLSIGSLSTCAGCSFLLTSSDHVTAVYRLIRYDWWTASEMRICVYFSDNIQERWFNIRWFTSTDAGGAKCLAFSLPWQTSSMKTKGWRVNHGQSSNQVRNSLSYHHIGRSKAVEKYPRITYALLHVFLKCSQVKQTTCNNDIIWYFYCVNFTSNYVGLYTILYYSVKRCML